MWLHVNIQKITEDVQLIKQLIYLLVLQINNIATYVYRYKVKNWKLFKEGIFHILIFCW